jgi:sugar phosphate isomerase/epimerase
MAMTLSIWTGIVYGEPLAEGLRFLKSCGWNCFELSTEHLEEIDEDGDPAARTAELRNTLSELSLTMPQAHAYLRADVAHPDEGRRRADIETLIRHMSHCAALGIRDAVIHPGGRHAEAGETQHVFNLNVESFRRLSEQAASLSLRIGIENMPGRQASPRFGARPRDLLDLIEAVGSPALGITFDTSHAHVAGLDLAAAIRECGDALWATHISDTDGSADQHLTPGNGTIDWPVVMQALHEVGSASALNFEIPGERAPTRDLLVLKLRYARRVADWLMSRP